MKDILEISARSGYIKEIIQRFCRYGTYEITGDLGFGNAAAHGFSVWFYRTYGEAEYSIRLRALVKSHPRFSDCVIAEPHLLCLGTRFSRNFCFFPNRRPSRLNEHDMHATYNDHLRETA
eukprot:IDg6642t1